MKKLALVTLLIVTSSTFITANEGDLPNGTKKPCDPTVTTCPSGFTNTSNIGTHEGVFDFIDELLSSVFGY